MTHRVLLVDDLRTFTVPRSATLARTSASALATLKEIHAARDGFDEVWLDHDLGDATGTNDTSMPVVDWLCEQAVHGQPVPIRVIYIHTSNQVGAQTMLRTLTRYGYTTQRADAASHLRVDDSLHAQALTRTPELPATTEAHQ